MSAGEKSVFSNTPILAYSDLIASYPLEMAYVKAIP